MEDKMEEKQLKRNEMDQWLEKFFLDPLTSYFDEVAFRIDLFETAEEYIIEAMLPQHCRDEINIYVESHEMKIRAKKQDNKNNLKERIISFPILINEHEICAVLHDDVLEIFIAKHKFCKDKNREIRIKESSA